MFASDQNPAPGSRATSRPDRHLVPGRPDPLDPRGSISTLGISAQVIFPGTLPGARAEAVAIAGSVTTPRPVAPVAVALIYDGDAPQVPTALPVPLVAAGGGRYSYTLPLNLPTGHAAGHHGPHRYAVSVTVQDPTSTANASANFALPTTPNRPEPAGRPHGRPR